MSSHGMGPPSSATLKLWPMSLVPNIVYWQFTARSEHAALKRRVWPTAPLGARVGPAGPAGKTPAVAAPGRPETIRIEERIGCERLVEGRHDVGIVAAAPVANYRLGEGLAVSLAASRVRVDDGVAGAGV